MTGAFVADASVAVAWVHPAQATPESEAWLDALAEGLGAVVPALWPLEVANALVVLARRGRLAAAERDRALLRLGELGAEVDAEAPSLALSRLAALAVEHDLSVYDAAYLDLALRRRLPLACKDGPLRRAALARGISVVPPAGPPPANP
jgi:predicted nucleic acid-binding protein